MKFDSMAAFIHMDGQGIYIWAAYGVTLFILAANVCWPLIARRKIIRQALQHQKTQPEDRS